MLSATVAPAMDADYGRTLIVPMTLVNARYRDEIFRLISKAGHPVLHVFLDVPAAELRRRIDAQILVENDPRADAEARTFRHNNVECCVTEREELPDDTLVLRGDQHTPARLADLVLEAMQHGE